MVSVEDGIRSEVRTNENQIKELRLRLLPMLTWQDGALVPDGRYKSDIQNIQAEEKRLRLNLERREAALSHAAELVNSLHGADRAHPLTWLVKQIETLQEDLNRCQRDITIHERKAGTRGMLAAVSDSVFQSFKDMNSQINENKKRVKELEPELKKLTKLREEVQAVLQAVTR